MHAGAGEKSKNQDITVAPGEASNRSELHEAQRHCKVGKKPHPACERAFCSSGMQGAAGVKIS
jgi:hypothetical protein